MNILKGFKDVEESFIHFQWKMADKAKHLKKYILLKYQKSKRECPEGAEHFHI